MNDETYTDTLPGGTHWSFVARRGLKLELTDVEGGGNAAMLLYNPSNPLERLNIPDTLKCQHTFRLTQGHCLYSDMGRIFCSIIQDDLGWHDAASGTCNAASVEQRFGSNTYQQARNDFYRNGRDCFLIELGKYGLGRRDLAANVNWFSRVNASEDGDTTWQANHSLPGSKVTLRFEMDTIVLIHTCPHPLDNTGEYPKKPIRLSQGPAEPVTGDDPCRLSCKENARGFLNTDLYNIGYWRGMP